MSSLSNGTENPTLAVENGVSKPGGQQSDIAIVGMSCRLPQEAENPEKLWEMLLHGRSACTEFPADKLNINAHWHPDPSRAGSVRSIPPPRKILANAPPKR